jgi:hypothetical protein
MLTVDHVLYVVPVIVVNVKRVLLEVDVRKKTQSWGIAALAEEEAVSRRRV